MYRIHDIPCPCAVCYNIQFHGVWYVHLCQIGKITKFTQAVNFIKTFCHGAPLGADNRQTGFIRSSTRWLFTRLCVQLPIRSRFNQINCGLMGRDNSLSQGWDYSEINEGRRIRAWTLASREALTLVSICMNEIWLIIRGQGSSLFLVFHKQIESLVKELSFEGVIINQ